MARAKRTDRTEARRRHRAEQAAQDTELDDDAGEATPGGSTRSAKATAAAPAAPAQQRPSFASAFRAAFRPADLRGDLRSLPKIVTHWGFLAAAGGRARRDGRVHPLDQRVRVDARPRALRPGRRTADRHGVEHLVHRREPVRRPAAGRRRVPRRLHGAAGELAGRPALRHHRGRLLQRDPAQPHGPPVHRRQRPAALRPERLDRRPRWARRSSRPRRPGTSGSSAWPTRTAAGRRRSRRRRAAATRAPTRG